MTLKELLGDSYKDDITIAEIDKALASKNLVDLASGNYISKDKYDRVAQQLADEKKSFSDYKEQTKDFENLKAENDKFKAEKTESELKAKLTALGISEKSYKYVKGDIDDGTLKISDDEKANKDAVAKYLKENPAFAIESKPQVRVFNTSKSTDDNADKGKTESGIPETNAQINESFRNALGRK